MRTRNSNFLNNSNATIPRCRNRGRAPNIVEPELRTIIAPMAERTMEELLRAPTEGYGEAIVLPKINADHFEIKTNLLQLVQANPFHGYERENPHAHINSFKRITSTLRFRDVPNDVIKLMMFPYSLEGNARLWYEKEPPNSILTWEDLVTTFVNQFFPPSKTTHLKNEISRFTQKFDESFSEVIRSGYQQKDRKPSQNDKTEHGMEKDCAKSRPKSKNVKVRVNTEESAVKPEPELKNTIGCNLNLGKSFDWSRCSFPFLGSVLSFWLDFYPFSEYPLPA
ncbi:reverse transcriptase domain-containing protein [Tanacetum coccineum]